MFLLICGWNLALAQSVVQVTQYNEVLPLYNPAFAGVENHTDIRFSVRRQWIGVPEGPFSTFAHVAGPLPDFSKKGRKIRYKSPYDINKMSETVTIPANGLRTSNPALVRKMIVDSIKLEVRKLDRKAISKLKRQYAPPSTFALRPKQGYTATLMADQYGAFTHYSLNGGYALHMPIDRKVMLVLGLGLTATNSQFNRGKAQVLNPANDMLYQEYASGSLDPFSVYLNTGINLYSEQFYLAYGISKVAGKGLGTGHAFGLEGVETQHTLLMGLHIPLGTDFRLSPGMLFSYKVVSPFAFYATSRLYYQDKLWIGANYRNQDAFGASFGFFFAEKYKCSYAFDTAISKLSPTLGSTHELTFGILLSKSFIQPILY